MTATASGDAAAMSTADQRRSYTDRLRALADWLDAHPEISLPWTGSEYSYFELSVWTTKEELAAIAKALPGKVKKTYTGHDTLDLTAQFESLCVRAYAGRNVVCERVIVGTETVVVPAVEAKPESTEVREVVEWRCESLLRPDTEAADDGPVSV